MIVQSPSWVAALSSQASRIRTYWPTVDRERWRVWWAMARFEADTERNVLLVKGSVPGADGDHIVVRPAVKTPAKKGA